MFLKTLYASGNGRAHLEMLFGLESEVRRNRWDSFIVMEIFRECSYIEEDSLVAGSIVADIGCYIGDFSLHVANNFGASVIAFEPSYDNYEIARSKIDRNRLGQLVELNQLVLDVAKGDVDLLKIDREGFEYSIIENAAVEEFDRIETISLEYHHIDYRQLKLDAMRKKLHQAGFTVRQHAPYQYCQC